MVRYQTGGVHTHGYHTLYGTGENVIVTWLTQDDDAREEIVIYYWSQTLEKDTILLL